ncbi:MAG: hypothetical protein JRC87_11590 [Deltaproteobacteria bacterium]|nr:hypothetical protein [Deltaproteobacteria bacterium]
MKLISIFLLIFSFTASSVFGSYCVNAKKGLKNSAAISRYLTDLADTSSGFAVVGPVGKGDSAITAGGKEIFAILISENASWENSSKPTVIITGAIHGNEWATPEVCIGIAEYLLLNKDNSEPAADDKGTLINEEFMQDGGNFAGDSIIPQITNIRQLLQTIQVIIIPVLNPDGYDYSRTSEGKKSYFGAGWRPNRNNLSTGISKEICYKQDGTTYESPPADSEHCFLADYDDTAEGGDLEEEVLVVCESADGKSVSLFEPSLSVSSEEMVDAIYDESGQKRVLCGSGKRRVWKEKWSKDDNDTILLSDARSDGYLQDAFGTDLNRNFQYKWDVAGEQKHLFIRSRSPSSRIYRGSSLLSERETDAMEQLVAGKNVVALIDYHAGSTQVLYPYAYSTKVRVNEDILGGKNDYDVFQKISEKIASLLNRHDRADKTIVNFTAAQNYNDSSVGSGVARDCYYQTEGIAAINIEVHDKQFTYGAADFVKVVPKICKTNVPGAIWFMFWAAELPPRKK